MTTRTLVFALVAGLAAASAWADGPTKSSEPWAAEYDQLRNFHGTLSRSEVANEARASREETRAMTGEDSGSQYLAQHDMFRSTLSRSEVASQARASLEEIHAMTGEDSGSAYLMRHPMAGGRGPASSMGGPAR